MSGKSLFQTALLIIFIVALIVAVLIFAGILPGFQTKKVGEAGNLVVWGTFSVNQYGSVMATLSKENEKTFTINYQDQGADLDGQLINALASGKGPDVIIAPVELILKHRDKFTLLPFASLPLRTYQEAFIDEGSLFTFADGFIALPIAVDPLLLYNNRDLYNNANIINPPANWEEFIKIQPTLTKVGTNNRLEKSAFALGTFSNNNNAKDILSLLIMQAGGSPVSSSAGKASVTLQNDFGFALSPAVAAVDFFTQFADPTKSTYCWNRSLPEARDSFLGENLANYFGFASEAPYLREKNPHLNFSLNIVPQMAKGNRQTMGRLYGVAVLKTTTKVNPAWAMTFALAGDNYSKLGATALNLAPARRSLLVPDPAQPDQKVVFDSALISRGWYDIDPAGTKEIFANMTNAVASGGLNTSEAVAKASGEISRLMGAN